MVLIALLLVALLCLVLGIALQSGPWLVGSLAASAAAAFVLWRMRARFVAARTRASKPVGDAPAAAVSDAAAPLGGAPVDTEVWVVDGQPDYHLASCARIAEHVSEAVPLSQATEDGFTACAHCRPDTQPVEILAAPPPGVLEVEEPTQRVDSPPTAGAGAEPSPESDVWVVDGRPRYHERDCQIIQGQDAEPISLAQAVEDGFMPCSLCEPAAARTP